MSPDKAARIAVPLPCHCFQAGSGSFRSIKLRDWAAGYSIVTLSNQRLGSCLQDTRKLQTLSQYFSETQAISGFSVPMMARNGQASSKSLKTNLDQVSSQPFAPSSMAPQKRKGSPQVKYYAVKAGHTPGVYLSWKECEQNISGFRGAAFKSFPTREEATAYVAGRILSSKSTQSSAQVEKFYGVARGRNPGVYTDWATAQEQITGWKFPKYKKFATRAGAVEFVRSGGNTNPDPALQESGENFERNGSTTDASVGEGSASVPRAAKRPRLSISLESPAFEYDVLSELERDILDPVGPTQITKTNQIEILQIHTDGSSLSNGQCGARAGLGVYFGPGDSRNVAERLPGMPQTNQRAELAAILRALEISPANCEVHIITDSQYSINCVTVWCKNWEKNNWQTATKQPVLNKDLIQGILNRIRHREERGVATRFLWIKGHSNNPGNEAADRLAVLGAQKSGVD